MDIRGPTVEAQHIRVGCVLWIPRFVVGRRAVPCENPLCQKKLDKDKHEFCPLTWKGSEHPAVVLATRHHDLEGKGRELLVTFAIVRISSFWDNEHDNPSRAKYQPDAFYLFDCTQQFLTANRDLEQSYFFENGIGAEKSNWAILQHSCTLPYSEFKTFGKITGPFYPTACDLRLDEKSYPKLVNQVAFPGHEEFVSTDKLRHGTGWWLVQTAKKFGEGSLTRTGWRSITNYGPLTSSPIPGLKHELQEQLLHSQVSRVVGEPLRR